MRGFTLLEVLVVLLIIGVLASTLSLSLTPDTQRQLEDESYRFARVLEQAVEAAREGEALGLELDADGYGFRRLDGQGRWRHARDDFLAVHHWPEGLRVMTLRKPAVAAPWLMWQDSQAPWLQFVFVGGVRRLQVELTPLGRVTVREARP